MNNTLFTHWRANFLTGLAIVLPAVISIALLIWLFGTAARFTDTILIFLPREWTHHQQGNGPPFWYASLGAFLLTVLMLTFVGMLTRIYIGKKLIESVDAGLLAVPLLNKIYGATKQIKDAVGANNKTSFRTAVLIEFPRTGLYSLGFITGEQKVGLTAPNGEPLVSVFVPTTPNPTSGFLVLARESELLKIDISVPEAIKYIISLGSITPEYRPVTREELVKILEQR